MVWVPTPGGYLNVMLPGELTRTRVDTLHSENCALVQILSVPMGKMHQYTKGAALFAIRGIDPMGQEVWQPASAEEAEAQIKADEEVAEMRAKEAEAVRQRALAKGARIHSYDVVVEGGEDRELGH